MTRTAKTAPKRKKAPPARKQPRTTRAPARSRAARRPARRADFGAGVDAFLAKQPPTLRRIVDELRGLVEEAAPDAVASLKWGMPFYTVGGKILCGIGAHRSHVNLVLPGPPGAFADPEGRLAGESRLGRHLKLTAQDEVPTAAVRGWLRTALGRLRG